MKRLIVPFLLFPLLLAAQDNDKTFKLKGRIHLPDSVKVDWILLEYQSGGEVKKDSVKLRNGRYQFSGKIKEPILTELRLLFPGQTSRNPYFW